MISEFFVVCDVPYEFESVSIHINQLHQIRQIGAFCQVFLVNRNGWQILKKSHSHRVCSVGILPYKGGGENEAEIRDPHGPKDCCSNDDGREEGESARHFDAVFVRLIELRRKRALDFVRVSRRDQKNPVDKPLN